MGLAEPRKRIKFSHDPNNLSWSQSTDSYGQRLMLSQGWKAGQGLGAHNGKKPYSSYDAAKVNVSFKDDNLGLGASLKSKDIEHSRTGLDAFQGLLGRLNGKSDAELEKDVKKVEDRNLALYTQGRWGGMTFVPGGLLIQGDGFKKQDEAAEVMETLNTDEKQAADDEATRSPKRKDERRREKEEKRRRKEEKRRDNNRSTAFDEVNSASDEPQSKQQSMQIDPAEEVIASPEKMKKRRKSKEASATLLTTSNPVEGTVSVKAKEPAMTSRPLPRNGRHILRGRNIEAKKMAFADAKMLDEIFMRRT